MQTLWAKQALTKDGWCANVRVSINDSGLIDAVDINTPEEKSDSGILLPAPANLHSHAFQRAMAGLSESRSGNKYDSFWSWRELMYRFVEQLRPEDVQAIAAFVQMEMLEAGYSAVAEFHYLHHQPGGHPYGDVSEMSARIIQAASETGIGLTLLPVLYQQRGCNGDALTLRQRRFGNDIDQFAQLVAAAKQHLKKQLDHDAVMGIAPHSLRAANTTSISQAIKLLENAPIHIHIAEQPAEVEEVKMHLGCRPLEWLLDNFHVDQRWCLIHATHLSEEETLAAAKSGAVAGICPITEANLGDGIFNAQQYLAHQGRFGIGSDSNIRIALCEELRLFEYTQRLRHQQRAVLAGEGQSTGRVLFEAAAKGSAQALGRNSGRIEVGCVADLIALDAAATEFIGKRGDTLLDSYIFSGDDHLVSDVWSAGRHLVSKGRHRQHERITENFRNTLLSLSKRI